MKKTVLIMMFLLIISKTSGLMRTMSISARYGSGYFTDIYTAAMIIPGVFISIFLAGINTSLVPVLSSAQVNGEKDLFFKRFISLISLISILIISIIIIFAEPLCNFVVSGYDARKMADVVMYTRILSSIAGMQLITYTFMGYLHQSGRYYIGAAVAIPMNIVIITGMIFSKQNFNLLIALTLFGYFTQLAWVIWPFIRSKYPFKFSIKIKDEYLFKFLKMIGPVLITTSAVQINVIVDGILSSSLAEGSLTLIGHASLVNGVFMSVIVLSFSTVLFTNQSKLASIEDRKELCLITKHNLSSVLFLIVPIIFGVLFFSKEIIQLLFYRGMFTMSATLITGKLLFFYSFALLSASVTEILSKFFFSIGKSKYTLFPTLINIFTNVILNLILVRIYGIYGLAIGSSIASFIGMAVIYIFANKYFKNEKVRIISFSLVKYFLGGFIMLIILFLLKYLTPIAGLPLILYVVILTIVGMLVYFGVLLYLRTYELILIINILKDKFRNRRKIWNRK